MELTRQDLDVLLEAVEAWETKDFGGEVMEALVTSMIPKEAEGRDKTMLEFEQKRTKRRAEQRVRKERSVILRAKLLTIRDSMDADRLLESSKQ